MLMEALAVGLQRSFARDLIQQQNFLTRFPLLPLLDYLQHRWRPPSNPAPTALRWLRGRVRRLFHPVTRSTSFGNSPIVDAYHEYAKGRGNPESAILHLCKRAGRLREIDAIQTGMAQVAKNVPYPLVHLNDDTNRRLFDRSHRTYIFETDLTLEFPFSH
jgi:hypothetical protein